MIDRIGKLAMVETDNINSIPIHLFRKLDNESWNTDRIVKYINNNNHPVQLISLVDDKGAVKGVLWYVSNYIEDSIDVLVLSIDKEYQFNSSIKDALDYVRKKMRENNLSSVKIRTDRPDGFSKYGFKTVGYIMETK